MGVGLKVYERCPFGLLTQTAQHGGGRASGHAVGFAPKSTSISHVRMGY